MSLMERKRFQLILRALRYRNYRLFVAGQGVSLVGTWMQQIAMSWLIYRLTGSALLLGLIGFTSQAPSLILTPLAGVLADRWDRRRLLVATQALAMLQAAVLAGVVLANVVQVWQVILLSVVLGVVNAFDIPIRQSFVVEMVENREDLGNAIALNSTLFNAARLIGPSLAGLIVATIGEGYCFLINSLSYLAVLAALAAMRLTPRTVDHGHRRVINELREGFGYAFGFSPIRSIIFLVALVSLMGMPYTVLMPLFAKEILAGGAHTYGFLMAASGFGALVSTLFLASRPTVLGLGRIITTGVVLFGAGLACFALSSSLLLSLMSLSVSGFGVMAVMASGNTILQTIVKEEMRGRVMSFHAVAINGVAPLGSLLAGFLAGSIGPRQTLLVGSISCLIGAVCFARHLPDIREKVRPIYVRKGIIHEVTSVREVAADTIVPG
jgi:MFS family permease